MKDSLIRECIEDTRLKIKMSDEKYVDKDVIEIIESIVLAKTKETGLGYRDKKEIIDIVFNSTRKDLDILQPYAEDYEVTEIMVNGPDNIFIEKNGKIQRVNEKFSDCAQLEEVIRRVAAKVHREINDLNPIVDARLDDGARVNAVYKNIALNGPILTIRKFPKKSITMKDLIMFETISPLAAEVLQKLVQARYNIFISGGTSSGKTTFLNVLSNFIPPEERIITIEDSAELKIENIDNIVALETKNANVQGKGEVTIRQLIKTSLRMRPDRIIVGEVRGAEALDMLQAMNTGHDGSLSTGHANSPQGMLSRLETMVLMAADIPLDAIRKQIASAIDIIVHLGRLNDKTRRVLEISEVESFKDGEIILNPLFKFQRLEEKGIVINSLLPTGNKLKNTDKLQMAGIQWKDILNE
ncbi:MAG: CpaF family protein [Clostridiales bacterium]|nr:CpaF family protein [Clostridiales bacterium]